MEIVLFVVVLEEIINFYKEKYFVKIVPKFLINKYYQGKYIRGELVCLLMGLFKEKTIS